MEWAEFLKLYGPMGLGWVCFGLLANWNRLRFEKDLQSRIDLALSINGLTRIIEERMRRGKT